MVCDVMQADLMIQRVSLDYLLLSSQASQTAFLYSAQVQFLLIPLRMRKLILSSSMHHSFLLHAKNSCCHHCPQRLYAYNSAKPSAPHDTPC